jgi:hypothetical protein
MPNRLLNLGHVMNRPYKTMRERAVDVTAFCARTHAAVTQSAVTTGVRCVIAENSVHACDFEVELL